jgi:hypothetical protein
VWSEYRYTAILLGGENISLSDLMYWVCDVCQTEKQTEETKLSGPSDFDFEKDISKQKIKVTR